MPAIVKKTGALIVWGKVEKKLPKIPKGGGGGGRGGTTH